MDICFSDVKVFKLLGFSFLLLLCEVENSVHSSTL